MPPSVSVSTQNSPREVYPFRTGVSSSYGMSPTTDHYSKVHHHLPPVQTASSSMNNITTSNTNSPTPLSSSSASSAFQFRDASFRELPLSPGPRGSVGSSTVIGSRGSLSSLASIGTRASLGSLGSLSSGDSNNALAVDPNASTIGSSMWQSANSVVGDDTTSSVPSGHVNSGNLPTAPSSASSLNVQKLPLTSSSNISASLHVMSLPRDLTPRESHFLFALAPDFLTVEMNRNAVSGDVSLIAKFSSLQGAQAAALAFERRNDIFGHDIKTSVHSFASATPSPFSINSAGSVASQNQPASSQPRNLYSSRPYFADSYWTQPPGTPLSPSTTSEIFSNSRRASLISPTDHINSHVGMASLAPGSPSHTPQFYEGTTFLNGGAPDLTAPASVLSSASSGSNTNTFNGLPANVGSPTSVPGSMGSSIFSQHSGHSSSSIGSVSPSSKSNSGLTGSAPISSTSTSTSSAPIGSSIGQQGYQQHSHPQSNAASPQNTGNSARHHLINQTSGPQTHVDGTKIPPPNPADQNPPCNTLYVGNLPPDTSENELKGLFSQQPGYRRLCFRTKQNGPMCFVEFDDEKLAGRALSELYGVALSNSVKGGIRLSYSKNPLGVRSRPVRSK